jgi:hypothetical protein
MPGPLVVDPMRRLAKWLVPARLHGRVRRLGLVFDRAALEGKVLRHRLRPLRPRQHGLPGTLILSLTSHKPRFPTLHRTLASLLRQSVRPDRLILWIGTGETLPPEVTALVPRGLDIREVRHLGPFTKLLPALAAFPDAFIATADDDAYYPPGWLENLIESHAPAAPAILCCRAHRIAKGADGAILPYAEWEKDVRDASARSPGTDLVPTGVGGVLYPPGALHPAVFDEALFTRLCPHTDDFWFYWMARRAGARHRLVGAGFDYRDWPGSQAVTLHADNLAGRYDREMAALAAHFGMAGVLAGNGCGF